MFLISETDHDDWGLETVCVYILTLQKTEIECPMLARSAVCTSVGGVHGSVQVALYAASSDTFDPWTVRGPAFAPRHFVWATNDLKFPIFNGFSKTNFLQLRVLSMWNAQGSADFSRCWCGGGTAILHISFHFCGSGVRQRKLTENSQQSWTPSIETLDSWCEPFTRVILFFFCKVSSSVFRQHFSCQSSQCAHCHWDESCKVPSGCRSIEGSLCVCLIRQHFATGALRASHTADSYIHLMRWFWRLLY